MKTDAQLRLEVERELEWDPSVPVGDIATAVKDGVVTLQGGVRSYAERWGAERAVERVRGVRGIASELEIRSGEEHTDTDIAEAAANALQWHAFLPTDQVVVKVQKGWVTLTGVLQHDYQRQAAERSVRFLRGVKGVTDKIVLESLVEPTDLTGKIQQSFARHAATDATRIQVESEAGEVTLRGTVRSWAERRDAERTAWAAPGVTAVHNFLTIQVDG